MGLGASQSRDRIPSGGRGPARCRRPTPMRTYRRLAGTAQGPSRSARSGGQPQVLVVPTVHPRAADHWTADHRRVCGGCPRWPQLQAAMGPEPVVMHHVLGPEPVPLHLFGQLDRRLPGPLDTCCIGSPCWARRSLSCFLAMSFALLYAAVRFLLDALLISRRSESRLQAEVLALRHQLRVFQRQVRRPRWQPADRLFLSALSRPLPSPYWSSLLPSPETLLRWHRELVRRRWAAYRSRPRRPQPIDRRARRETIVRLAEENPRWGYRRIQGELLKLGMRCSHLTVVRVLSHHRLGPAPRRTQRSWRSFVGQHADQMLACDFFVFF